MLVTLLPMVTEVRLLQSQKALSPMLVTSFPIIYSVTCPPNMLLKLLLDEYALLTIVFEFRVTEVRLLQPEKADPPILVTLLGMVTEVRLLQPRKVDVPMLVTLLGITRFVIS